MRAHGHPELAVMASGLQVVKGNPSELDQGRKRLILVGVAAVVFVVDIASKVVANAALRNRYVDLPGPLDLRLAHNPGLAFSMGNNAPIWLVLTVTGAVACAIAVAAWRGHFASAIAAGVVVGGAAANVADRAQAGTVVDMLYTGWWPTFNVADVAIVCGAFALAATAWRAPPEPATVP